MGLINCALNLSRKTGGRNQKFRQPCQASIEVGWMSTLGHKWTLSDISAMSALPPKADIAAPLIAIVLRGWIDVVELQFFQKQSVKLRFQRPDCDEPAVRANVGVIEWRIVKRARQGPIDLAVGTNSLQDSTEHCDDIDDGGVRAR